MHTDTQKASEPSRTGPRNARSLESTYQSLCVGANRLTFARSAVPRTHAPPKSAPPPHDPFHCRAAMPWHHRRHISGRVKTLFQQRTSVCPRYSQKAYCGSSSSLPSCHLDAMAHSCHLSSASGSASGSSGSSSPSPKGPYLPGIPYASRRIVSLPQGVQFCVML